MPATNVLVAFKKLPHFDGAFSLPQYETSGASGADVKACLDDRGELVIRPGERILVPTGLAVSVPEGYELQVRARSGLSLKSPLLVCNGIGTVDADYRGEVKVILGNFGGEDFIIRHGDRIAQFVIAPVVQAQFLEVETLNETQRGAGGFGHTGGVSTHGA